jgi:hypothetical protein
MIHKKSSSGWQGKKLSRVSRDKTHNAASSGADELFMKPSSVLK